MRCWSWALGSGLRWTMEGAPNADKVGRLHENRQLRTDLPLQPGPSMHFVVASLSLSHVPLTYLILRVMFSLSKAT